MSIHIQPPSREQLETFANQFRKRDYTIEIICPEFTSMCPKTGQPDFGTLSLRYIPEMLCVELKSLKLYLQAFRNEGIFYENVTNRIFDDLIVVLSPRQLTLAAHFTPKGRLESEMTHGIPLTYVPARNTIFLSLALGLAEARGAHAIVLGVNAVDYSGYPDCRPEFLRAFAQLSRLATKAGIEGEPIEILAPLVSLTKVKIIQLGLLLKLDYGLTTSCYDPDDDGRPCHGCDSCLLRAAGFQAAGAIDPRSSHGQGRQYSV